MTVSLCYGFVYIIVATFQCLPVSYAWTRWDGEHSGMCIDVNAATWAASAINISIDLTIIIIPMPMLVRLNLSRRKKVQVVAMFSVGLLCVIPPYQQLTRDLMHTVSQLSVLFDWCLWSNGPSLQTSLVSAHYVLSNIHRSLTHALQTIVCPQSTGVRLNQKWVLFVRVCLVFALCCHIYSQTFSAPPTQIPKRGQFPPPRYPEISLLKSL